MKKHLYSALLLVNASAVATFAQAAAPAKQDGGLMGMLPMMLVMFVIIYFLMIRPQQKKQKEQQNMLKNVKKGDKIATIGGIIGTVGMTKDGEDTIMVKIAENTVIELRKAAIAAVLNPPADKIDNKEEKKK
ncbi:MAG: preprotein translocase subunit YajC [Chitinivibrionales bacterium]|nr:preprotein translocase subunit YajC [Chitinivibrionales bacterium]